MVAGLEDITGGEIAIGGRVVNQLEPGERDCAMVFQSYALYPHMTVVDNMGYALKIPRCRSNEIKQRVERRRGPEDAACSCDRKPAHFPAANGSVWPWPAPSCASRRCSCSTNRCRTWTRNCAPIPARNPQAAPRLGITSVFVTHDQVEAMTLAHRMIV